MTDGMAQEVTGFLRRLSPAAVRGVDAVCDFLVPILRESPDPRVNAVITALKVGCTLRARRRRG